MPHPLLDLTWSLLPLMLFASISPVVFLNASTAVSTGGQRGGWQFVGGNAAVLAPLGLAFVGLLGTAASSFAQREIASETVDRVLGLALIGYGAWMTWQHRRSRRTQADAAAESAAGGGPHANGGLVAWGALGMATNFTTLPVFAAASQRIGAADIDWGERLLVLALCIAVALTPSWLPVVIARLNPRRGDVSPEARAKVAHWTTLVSIGACFVGGVVLVLTSLRGVL